ncbi:MAG: hypothetical protein H0V73_09175 [Chloroflexi bacterium]|nr:hypothetical protein [Chloroflexota bacterium]
MVLIVAGLAVAGTSMAMPTPAPPVSIGLNGAASLSAEHPSVIVRFDVTGSDLESVSLRSIVANQPESGHVIASVVALEDEPNIGDPAASGSPIGARTLGWNLACPSMNECTRPLAVVLTWLDAPEGGSTTTAWSIEGALTHSGLRGASGPPETAKLTMTEDPSAAADATFARGSSGEPVHLSESDRFRYWTLRIRLGDGTAGEWAGWPLIAQARLTPTVAQTAGEPAHGGDRKDRRVDDRPDLPVQLRILDPATGIMTRWTDDGPLEFDPFAGCATEGICEITRTVGLAWADGRPDAEFDASWTLDIAEAAAEGKTFPIAISVKPIEPPRMATATASGSLDVGTSGDEHSIVPFRADAGPLDADTPWIDGAIPVRALVHVRVTAAPGAPPVPDGTIVSIVGFGGSGAVGDGLQTSAEVVVGEEVDFAFEPLATCRGSSGTGCVAVGRLVARISWPRPDAAPPGMLVHVEWTVEVGLATDADSGLHLDAGVRSGATPAPSASRKP